MVIAVDDTTVVLIWKPIDSSYVDHYTVYYYPELTHNSRMKRQVRDEKQVSVFQARTSSGVIRELAEGETYLFSIAVTFIINGQLYEGDNTAYISTNTGTV